MALRAAKQLYPNLEIHFVARDRFAAAAKRISWIHKVITLPTDALLQPIVDGSRSEQESLGEVARWVAPLVKDSWDLIVNWSYSPASSWLTGLLPAKVKLGYNRRRDGSFSSADGWSHYVQAVIQGGVKQNIHLTDIFTTQLLTALQIHVGEPADEGNSPVTSKSFFILELGESDLGLPLKDSSKKWVAIQLGAGNDSKTWDATHWATLSHMVLQRHSEVQIVLLGGKEDADRARIFKATLEKLGNSALNSRVISLVGQTDFDLWASVIGRAQWLFSGDTAALHLASVLGTRVMNVSVGPVAWTETGPYGNGHYVVSSAQPCEGCTEKSTDVSLHTCRLQVTPQAVYGTWTYASSEWSHRRELPIEKHFSNLGYSQELAQIQIHRSKIRGTQDGGGVLYEPLTQGMSALHEWVGMVMGHVARAWYCGWVPPVGQELDRGRFHPSLIQKLRELDESSQVLQKIWLEASQLATVLQQKSAKLKSNRLMTLPDRQDLLQTGKQLQELDALVDRLGVAQPALRGFVQMSKVLMHNLNGSGITDLGKESAESYKQLHEGVTILRDWLKHSLSLAKPVAVARAPIAALPSAPKLEPNL
jgi:ADP-heptose:LPS heptosyltransferase